MFFFFNDTATTEIYTLSLHDALPILLACPEARIYELDGAGIAPCAYDDLETVRLTRGFLDAPERSEEHTSELQSRQYLVCRLLLEKKKTNSPVSILYTIHILHLPHPI